MIPDSSLLDLLPPMVAIVVAVVIILLAVLLMYAKASSEMLRPVLERQRCFDENYCGKVFVTRSMTAEVKRVSCYKPGSVWGRLKRLCLQDVGRMEVRFDIDQGVPMKVWDTLFDMDIAGAGRYRDGGCYVDVEIPSLNGERINEAGREVELALEAKEEFEGFQRQQQESTPGVAGCRVCPRSDSGSAAGPEQGETALSDD